MDARPVRTLLRESDVASELAEITEFLCAHEWPFHSMPRLGPGDVAEMSFAPPGTRTFWIDVERDGGSDHAGLLRLQDIDDIGDGCPIFDIRIAPPIRGFGVGRSAVAQLVALVFREYPAAHRLEATTRFDNAAMRRVLEHCGFTLEGRLRETWPAADGTRYDTVIYGILRREAPASTRE